MKTAESNCPDCGCELCQCPNHIEDVRGMVPVATLHDDGCFSWKSNDFRRKYRDDGFAGWRMDVYAAPADCPRCAELSESINNRAREQAQKTVNNGVYLDKLATLEAELSGLRARYLRMKSEDAATIAQLRDENARLTQYKDGAYTALQKKNDELDALQSTIAQQAEQLAAAQARIDALMLEYCPKDMTPEQLANYAAHQRPATPEEQAAIDAAIAAQKVNHAQP